MSENLLTARLALKPIASNDIDAVALAAETTNTDRITTLVRRSAKWWRSHGYGVWVLLDAQGENCLGWYGLRPGKTPNAPELFYGLAPDSQGHGFATEAGLAVLRFAFKDRNIRSVWAATEHSNAASIAVMERIGMEFENRTDLDGLDSVIYRIERNTHRTKGM